MSPAVGADVLGERYFQLWASLCCRQRPRRVDVPLSRKPWLAVGLLELSVLRVGQLVGCSIDGRVRRE